jgi:hypothetical protein
MKTVTAFTVIKHKKTMLFFVKTTVLLIKNIRNIDFRQNVSGASVINYTFFNLNFNKYVKIKMRIIVIAAGISRCGK